MGSLPNYSFLGPLKVNHCSNTPFSSDWQLFNLNKKSCTIIIFLPTRINWQAVNLTEKLFHLNHQSMSTIILIFLPTRANLPKHNQANKQLWHRMSRCKVAALWFKLVQGQPIWLKPQALTTVDHVQHQIYWFSKGSSIVDTIFLQLSFSLQDMIVFLLNQWLETTSPLWSEITK